ncbi:MAG: hypothetical protein ABL949_17270 [Fimbriimonadaceae bacterium]
MANCETGRQLITHGKWNSVRIVPVESLEDSQAEGTLRRLDTNSEDEDKWEILIEVSPESSIDQLVRVVAHELGHVKGVLTDGLYDPDTIMLRASPTASGYQYFRDCLLATEAAAEAYAAVVCAELEARGFPGPRQAAQANERVGYVHDLIEMHIGKLPVSAEVQDFPSIESEAAFRDALGTFWISQDRVATYCGIAKAMWMSAFKSSLPIGEAVEKEVSQVHLDEAYRAEVLHSADRYAHIYRVQSLNDELNHHQDLR